MSTITSNGTGGGNWSATSSWIGGIVPVSGDKVIISENDTIILDGLFTAGDSSTAKTNNNAAINVHGYLKASRTQDSGLTAVGSIWVNLDVFAEVDFGKVADPIPAIYTATLNIGADSSTGNKTGFFAERSGSNGNNENRCGFYSQGTATRINICKASAPVTTSDNTVILTVSNHGWQAGDVVYVPTSKTNTATDEAEILTVLSVAGAAITFATNFSASKKVGCWFGNMTRNVKIIAHTGLGRISLDRYNQFIFGETEFVDFDGWNYGGFYGSAQQASGDGIHLTGCSNYRSTLLTYHQGAFYNGQYYLDDCVFASGTSNYNTQRGQTLKANNCLIHGMISCNQVSRVENSWINPNNNASNIGMFYGCIFSGRVTSMNGYETFTEYNDCDIGFTHGLKSYFSDNFIRLAGAYNALTQCLIKNCKIQPNYTHYTRFERQYPLQHEQLLARYEQIGNDPLDNKYFTQVYTVEGDPINTVNSNLSLKFTPHNHSNVNGLVGYHEVEVPARNGETINLVGYIKVDTTFHNAGVWAAPYVEISGAGITPVTQVATVASSGNWEKFDISATNNQVGYDAKLTFRIYISRLGDTNQGSVYLAGLPIAPFATQCRHYGYVFNESSLVRNANSYTAATEAIANGYTGVSISSALREISFAAGTVDALQKLYDYSQVWSVSNLSSTVPFSRAGDTLIVDSGWTMIEPYFSGLISWTGGTIRYTTPGVKTDTVSSAAVSFTSAGTYTLTGAILSDVVLTNDSAGSVVVNVLSGTTYTISGINIVVNQVFIQRHLSFYITDSAGTPLTGYEWRIYESDASIGIIGLVELAGEEVAVSSSQDYAYSYTTDKPAVIQILNQPLNREMLLDVTLLNQDQNFTLKLESQENI